MRRREIGGGSDSGVEFSPLLSWLWGCCVSSAFSVPWSLFEVMVSPSGTNLVMSSCKPSVSASVREMASPRRTSTS